VPCDRWRRLRATLLLAVLALFWGQSVARAVCPMHEGGASAASAHATGSHHQPASPSEGATTHGCNCVGGCMGGAPLAVVASSELALAGAALQLAVPHSDELQRLDVRLQRRLPYAHAPPAARLT